MAVRSAIQETFFLKKNSPRRFQKKSLSRYDAARPRFSPHEPRGARRFFGDPMALIRFTATFLPARANKNGRPNFFSGQNPRADFPNFFSLSRYDAARPRFSPYELCGARRFFGDPMALIRFTTTFFATRPKLSSPEGIHIFTLHT
jgi:hypothetical protein